MTIPSGIPAVFCFYFIFRFLSWLLRMDVWILVVFFFSLSSYPSERYVGLIVSYPLPLIDYIELMSIFMLRR